MNFLHYEFTLSPHDFVEVTLTKQANVILLDDINFSHYKNVQRYSYHGGVAKTSPVRLQAPHAGHWNLVIDLGGQGGAVTASARIIAG